MCARIQPRLMRGSQLPLPKARRVQRAEPDRRRPCPASSQTVLNGPEKRRWTTVSSPYPLPNHSPQPVARITKKNHRKRKNGELSVDRPTTSNMEVLPCFFAESTPRGQFLKSWAFFFGKLAATCG